MQRIGFTLRNLARHPLQGCKRMTDHRPDQDTEHRQGQHQRHQGVAGNVTHQLQAEGLFLTDLNHEPGARFGHAVDAPGLVVQQHICKAVRSSRDLRRRRISHHQATVGETRHENQAGTVFVTGLLCSADQFQPLIGLFRHLYGEVIA